ncbi:hypothetical protein SVIO_094330 [Streptomyces violaceusniger]|uniref:Transposase IS200-like domain-containing protein n=1 Tax=Streptomyces violaceusniger TaxID=68280 RepID=A0A4D4LI28_STRVO|nr:hypothetical protein SVIO_094330 [Streptomyces violaceusniger]
MAGYQNIRTGRHCTFALHAHLVFVTEKVEKLSGSTVREPGQALEMYLASLADTLREGAR